MSYFLERLFYLFFVLLCIFGIINSHFESLGQLYVNLSIEASYLHLTRFVYFLPKDLQYMLIYDYRFWSRSALQTSNFRGDNDNCPSQYDFC